MALDQSVSGRWISHKLAALHRLDRNHRYVSKFLISCSDIFLLCQQGAQGICSNLKLLTSLQQRTQTNLPRESLRRQRDSLLHGFQVTDEDHL